MINDLKFVDGVLYQLSPKDKRWVPVAGQAAAQRGEARVAVQRDKPVARGGDLWLVAEYWKSIAATRKTRNNELADMMRTARTERDELRRSLATVTKQRDDARQFSSARGTRAAQLSVRVHALSIALKEMVQLAKCYIPAGHKNSIVEDAIKVLADTK